jgi:alkylation response protein AidB-like acyl-CoA dehydrogenase
MIQTSSLLTTDALELPESLRSAIESGRAEAEAQRRLPVELAETLRAAGAFGLTTPVEYGGLELSLSDTVEVYDAFGQIDGPVAWNIWNGNLGFAAGLLSEEGASAIWSGPGPIIANSARPTGVASPVRGGYELSGKWDIVSAIDVADWVALFAIAMDDTPDVRVLFLPQSDVTILDTWHTGGMRGTGSKTVVVDGAFVPSALAISPFAPARIDRPLYRIPAFTIASTGAAPIVLGIAQAAIDEIVSMAPTKGTDNGDPLSERPHAHSRLGVAQTSLDAARALLRSTAAGIDATAAAAEPVTEMHRARLRAAMSHAADVTRDVLLTCQQLASSTAIYTGNTIERLVRDGNVATQHFILATTHHDILGRLMVGLDAGTPVV